MSTIFMQYIFHTKALSFVSDSNRILAVAVAISTFLWLKNLNISYNKIINAIGGSTFGVLLIHANSDASVNGLERYRGLCWPLQPSVFVAYSIQYRNRVYRLFYLHTD